MTERELDLLIAESLHSFAETSEEDGDAHTFSPGFERRMRVLFGGSPPIRRLRFRRVVFALIAALLASLAMSMSAVASRTKRSHTFADTLEGYRTIDEDEPSLENPVLSLDLSGIPSRFEGGVEIRCGEQETRFFHDDSTGEFLECSNYPKVAFRYRMSLPDTEPVAFEQDGREMYIFSDQSGMRYLLWSTPSAVIVLRSNLPQTELTAIAGTIEVTET